MKSHAWAMSDYAAELGLAIHRYAHICNVQRCLESPQIKVPPK
jgi:hypothetical protein